MKAVRIRTAFDPNLKGAVIVTVPSRRAFDTRVRDALTRAGADLVTPGRGYEVVYGWGAAGRAARVADALATLRR